MGKPLNMNPEDYVRSVLEAQQKQIEELQAQLAGQSDITLSYTFSANTAEPPGSNQVRINGATLAATTKIWADRLTTDGIDATNAILTFHPGDRAYVQDKNDASCFARYDLTAAPIAKSGYLELPVVLFEAGVALNGGQPAILALLHRE